MKKLILICMIVVAILFASGCVTVGINSSGGLNSVQGTGSVVSQDFNVADFNGLSIFGNFVVVYQYSATNAVTVVMQENLFEYLEVSVTNTNLNIEASRGFNTTNANRPRVYISAPYLQYARFDGAINAEDWDTITTQRLHIVAAGAANATISIDVDEFEILVAGAGDFDVSGNATDTNITVTGAGTINATTLQTANAIISVAGAGNAYIAVSDTLDVTIAGVGNVRYVGDPHISQSIAGFGSVRRMD